MSKDKIFYEGEVYRLRTAAVVNYSVWDTTLLQEARKWIRSQLQKKRRVFQNIDDALDFAFFSTDVNSVPKLKTLITTKFKTFKEAPTLKEITSADQFENEEVDIDDVAEDEAPEAPEKVVASLSENDEELEEAVSTYTTRRRL